MCSLQSCTRHSLIRYVDERAACSSIIIIITRPPMSHASCPSTIIICTTFSTHNRVYESKITTLTRTEAHTKFIKPQLHFNYPAGEHAHTICALLIIWNFPHTCETPSSTVFVWFKRTQSHGKPTSDNQPARDGDDMMYVHDVYFTPLAHRSLELFVHARTHAREPRITRLDHVLYWIACGLFYF